MDLLQCLGFQVLTSQKNDFKWFYARFTLVFLLVLACFFVYHSHQQLITVSGKPVARTPVCIDVLSHSSCFAIHQTSRKDTETISSEPDVFIL